VHSCRDFFLFFSQEWPKVNKKNPFCYYSTTSNSKFCGNETKRRSKHLERLLEKERLVVNHYSGSWESYSSRPNDPRIGLSKVGGTVGSIHSRSYDKWLVKQQQSKDYDSNTYDVDDFSSIVLRPWLKGFC